jgi:hypothetical protein
MALSNDIIVEDLKNLGRRRHALAGFHQGSLVLLPNDFHAQLDAFIANEHRWAGNKLADLVLALSAEGAIEGVLGLRSTRFAHTHSFPSAPGNTRFNRGLGRRDFESIFDHDPPIRIKTPN